MAPLKQPLIFDIIQGSHVDGPGHRTVVFLKGCPLQCVWCHNPESQSTTADVFFYPQKCQSCPECEGVECIYNARQNVGIYYKPADIVGMILKNKTYFGHDGGVTFSGGEPLLWPEYLLEVCELLKQEEVKICFDTSGQFNYDKCKDLLQKHADLVLFDLKIIDPNQHKEYTGIGNTTILDNFKKLYTGNIAIQPIIPLIPQITANRENLVGIATFLSKYQLPAPIFKPFHASMMGKYEALGKTDKKVVSETPMSMEKQQKGQTVFAKAVYHFE